MITLAEMESRIKVLSLAVENGINQHNVTVGQLREAQVMLEVMKAKEKEHEKIHAEKPVTEMDEATNDDIEENIEAIA